MRLIITESQFKSIFYDMTEYLNNHFSENYEICGFEFSGDDNYPLIKLKLDKKWVNKNMSNGEFIEKQKVKQLVDKSKELIIDKYNEYVQINVYAGKC